MPVEENIYNRAQMNVPPEFPDILKQFSKAAIRTQPSPDNILEWSNFYYFFLMPCASKHEFFSFDYSF